MKPVPLWRRYDRLLGPDPAADVKDELRFHLEAKVDDLVAQGWSPGDARKEAERQFGNILAIQHLGERIGEHMDRRRRLTDYWTDVLRSLLDDLRLALRLLRRAPGFATTVLLTLAVGIGANTMVFSVVRGVLLKPLSYPQSDRLVGVWYKAPDINLSRLGIAPYLYFIDREQSKTLE